MSSASIRRQHWHDDQHLAVLTNTLELPEVDLAYDVRGPLPTADGRPPLMMIGQPMDASGFAALASHFPDRTVVTYDPRGLGRSVRKDGRTDNTPEDQADDVHAVIEALGAGPVELFASSGGAVTALALVAAHPGRRRDAGRARAAADRRAARCRGRHPRARTDARTLRGQAGVPAWPRSSP